MPAPTVVYSALSVTVPANSTSTAQVSIEVPYDTWFSWLTFANGPRTAQFTPWVTASIVSITGGSAPTVVLGTTSFSTAQAQTVAFNVGATVTGNISFGRLLDQIFEVRLTGFVVTVKLVSTDPLFDVEVAGLFVSFIDNPNALPLPAYSSSWLGTPPETFPVGLLYPNRLRDGANLTGIMPNGVASVTTANNPETTLVTAYALPDPAPGLIAVYWYGQPNTFTGSTSTFTTTIIDFYDADGVFISFNGSSAFFRTDTPFSGYQSYTASIFEVPPNAVYWYTFAVTPEPVDGAGDILAPGPTQLNIDFYTVQPLTSVLNSGVCVVPIGISGWRGYGQFGRSGLITVPLGIATGRPKSRARSFAQIIGD